MVTRLIGAILIAAAIVVSAVLNGETRYTLSASTGQTVWRIDTRTGRVSMCGDVVSGMAFSFAQEQRVHAIAEGLVDSKPPKLTQDVIDTLNRSRPKMYRLVCRYEP